MKIIQLLDMADAKSVPNMSTKNNTSLDLQRPKLLVNRFVSSAQEGSHRIRETPKSSININFIKQPPIVKKEKPFTRPPVKDSLRERHIKEWAFKKVDLKDLLKSKDFDPKNGLQLKKHEIWFDDDDLLDNKKNQIDLSELIDPEADEEFYRQHRNSGMYKNKADAQKNILFKLLDKRLLDISKDRFKFMNYVDYQKKIFIKKQLMKSKSLPGLNCKALETFNPHQFDQLHDLEAALNNSRKKPILAASAIRRKSSIKALNLSIRPNTHRNTKGKQRSSNIESDTQENDSFRFDINPNSISNNIQKTAEENNNSNTSNIQISINNNNNNNNNNDKINNVNTNSLNQPNQNAKSDSKNSIIINLDGLNKNNNVLHESFLTTRKLTTTFFEDSFGQNEPQANYLSDSKRISNRDLTYRSQKRDTLRSYDESLKSFRSPIIDRRFNNLISFIKPCYLHQDSKDMAKIISENEALRTNHFASESKEKLRKMKENGERLADIAKKVIETGEYDFV